jgi:DNA-binding MarR family transcriptional regulator
MPAPTDPAELRAYRNSRLYRSLIRVLRVYNRFLVEEVQARGFELQPSFPSLLANLDLEGSRIGVLAMRAGVTRQAAGQLLVEIEAAGFVSLTPDPDDGRATLVQFTPKGRKLFAAVIQVVEEFDRRLADILTEKDFDLMRANLAMIADRIDPEGALGSVDRAKPEPFVKPRTKTRR